jgi:hypothetical protein
MPGPEDVPSDIPVIYGDKIDRETRYLLAMLALSGEKHVFIAVDVVKGEHTNKNYANLNPSKEIPMTLFKQSNDRSLTKVLGSQ